jgi:hypothetical protein
LLDVAKIECARTLAAKALAELRPESTGLSRYVASVAVLDLLDQEFGVPVGDPNRERRLKDLRTLVDSDENEQAFRQLIDAWYD